MAHVDRAVDFREAVRAGADWIAHLPGFAVRQGEDWSPYLLTLEDARAAARKGVVVIPTLGAYRLHRQDLTDVLGIGKKNLGVLLEAGVKLAMGSDEWIEPGVEIVTLAETGLFSPPELLRLATESTARILFPERKIGRLVPGFEASFVVLGQDPLENLDGGARPGLKKVEQVVKRGLLVFSRSF